MLLPNRVDLNLLRVLDAIFTRGGVSEAARYLNLSQPAISHSLAKLRAAFGDQLFVRHGNGIVPTATTRAIIQPIRDALRSIDIAVTSAGLFDPAKSRRLFNLGLRPASEVPGFPGLVARLLGEAPGISVSSSYFARSGLDQALARGTLDLALDVRRSPTIGIHSMPIEPSMPMVVARVGHPTVAETINLEQYLSVDHVFASPRANGLGLEDAALASMGHRRNIKIRCQSALTAWQIVASSDLLCTLPQSFAAALGGIGHHRLLPLPFALAPNELHLYWHESSETDPGAVWLRTATLAHFAAAFE